MRVFLQLRLTSFLFLPLSLLTIGASTNYKLDSLEFGAAGGAGQSANYYQETVLGEAVADTGQSPNFKIGEGLLFAQQSNAPTLTIQNTSNWYNKLKITINTQNNPSDTKYVIAVSTDNFATTQYVQSDNTIGATLGPEDIRTYASFGGASGFNVIGLSPNTTYYVKAKAQQGKFTESPYGPVVSAATSQVSLDFDIDVASSDSETAPPYTLSLGSLTLGSVTTASNKIWVDLDTNADYGGYVYVYSSNGGLKSSALNYTITSATADLSSVNSGFGIQNSSITQSGGGPFTVLSPYNGTSNNVGVVDTTIRETLHTSSSPITAGRASFLVKAKASTTTPAATDYSETITLIASASF